MKMLMALCIMLSGCATWQKSEKAAQENDDICLIVCNYYKDHVNAAYSISSTECRCYISQFASLNSMHSVSMNDLEANLICAPDCKTVAGEIMQKHSLSKSK